MKIMSPEICDKSKKNPPFYPVDSSAADVKMDLPILAWSLKTSIVSLTSSRMDDTFWGVVRAAVVQSRREANMVAQGDGKSGPWGWPQISSRPKKKTCRLFTENTGQKLFSLFLAILMHSIPTKQFVLAQTSSLFTLWCQYPTELLTN